MSWRKKNHPKFPKPTRWLWTLGLIGWLGYLFSCTPSTGSSSSEGSGNDSLPQTGWTITLTPSQNTVPHSIASADFPVLNTLSVTIQVKHTAGFSPSNGQLVYLTCTNGSFGFKTADGKADYSQPITSHSAVLNQGQAIVTFTAGFSGPTIAHITAQYRDAVQTTTIDITENPYTSS